MRSTNKQLVAEDGHTLNAYVSEPSEPPIGAVVILQEIFGVNAYVRSVADSYAKEGFLAVAPALFDRVERGVELKYEGADRTKAVELMQKLNPKTALLDIASAFLEAKATDRGVGVVGFCYGGFLSWLTATRGEEFAVRPDCCVGLYPGGIGSVATENPSCPVMLHFGADDTHIGPEQIQAVRSAHPEVEIFVYDGAEHGFCCDARSAFNPGAASLARQRTLAFLKTHIA